MTKRQMHQDTASGSMGNQRWEDKTRKRKTLTGAYRIQHYVTLINRYVSNYKDGKWDEGTLTEDPNVVINECAGILQYCQECFEGLKAYTTEDGSIVTFRPDLNAERMMDSCARLEMPQFPKERFMEALDKVVKANEAWVPPYGSGATLYIRPYMFASGPVIGVKPSTSISSVFS